MTKKKLFSVACLVAAIVAGFCLQTNQVTAQSSLARKWRESEPPEPAYPASDASQRNLSLPTPTPPALIELPPRATFTFGDGRQIKARSQTGRFRLVGLRPNETVDIAVQFAKVLPANTAMAQPLDGGTLISFSRNSGGVSGLASIRFQVGSQPGLYRIRVPGWGGSSLLQFWVPDPNNPKANLPVVNPGH